MTKPLDFNLNLFDLTMRIKGFPVQEAQARLREIKQIPEARYLDYLQNAKTEILQYHLNNNAFYKKFVGSQDISNWENIPVLQKKDLQMPLQDRLSDGFSLKKVYTGKTSGSSGTPFYFAKDKMSHAMTWAVILDRYAQYGITFGASYQARFYGIPLDVVGNFKERFKDVLSNRLRFPVFDLSDATLKKYVAIFRKKKFEHIYGYTSSLVLFANYLKKNNMVLSSICNSLRYCIVTSEMLFDDDKKLLEETFGVPVINEYGASELDIIGFTDPESNFLLNSETLFIEILDDHNKPVPKGAPGNLVITSLYNKAHPMIRYAIGDVGILGKKSTPKKMLLEQLIGRTNDVAVLANGKRIPGLTFYYVTKSIIKDSGFIKEFMVEQQDLQTFVITYVATEVLSEKQIKEIKKALALYVEDDLSIIIKKVPVLERSKSGKLKQFISHL